MVASDCFSIEMRIHRILIASGRRARARGCVDFELEVVDNWSLSRLWRGNIAAMGMFVRAHPILARPSSAQSS